MSSIPACVLSVSPLEGCHFSSHYPNDMHAGWIGACRCASEQVICECECIPAEQKMGRTFIPMT